MNGTPGDDDTCHQAGNKTAGTHNYKPPKPKNEAITLRDRWTSWRKWLKRFPKNVPITQQIIEWGLDASGEFLGRLNVLEYLRSSD